MPIIDISWPISNEIVTYKNKQDVKIHKIKNVLEHGACEHQINFGLHTGTHVDAPAHFLANGQTLDQINLNQLVGKCELFDLTHVSDHISLQDLIDLDFEQCQIALFKTKNSLQPATGAFEHNFIYLDASAAQYLAAKNLQAIGIDGLGIERNQPGHPTHKTLLGQNILIIEGLRLAHVSPGIYQLICLPLHIVGVDSAPARAILSY